MDANLFSKCIERVEQDVKAALADMEPHPYISIGGAKTQQPFEVLVREIATDYSIEDVVTNTYMGASRGGYSITFSVGVELWAKTADLVKSTTTTQTRRWAVCATTPSPLFRPLAPLHRAIRTWHPSRAVSASRRLSTP